MNKPKSKTNRAARRKVAVPLEPLSEPVPSPVTPSPPTVPGHAANGEDETSLARLADDGGLPPSENETEEDALARVPADPLLQPPPPSMIPPAPPVAAVAASPAVAADPLSLEQRVRRLEDALAQLQEQHGVETRIAPHPATPRPANPQPIAPPAAGPASAASAAMLFDVGKRLWGAASDAVTQTPSPSSTAPPSAGSGALWLLWDTWAEARAIVRMFLDPRYHLPWSSRVIPLVLLAAILTSKYWVPGSSIPVLGEWLLVKLVDLLLAFLLFKWLGHEARRYRQSSPDLPSNLRL